MFGMTIIRPNPAVLLFLLVIASVYGVSFFASTLLQAREDAELLAFASILDMVVLVPVAYYFLIVRSGRAKPISLAPVLILSILLAGLIIPPEFRSSMAWLKWALIPFELFLVAFLAIKARAAFASQGAADPVLRFRDAAQALAGEGLLARAIASEVALFYYGFGAWQAQPHCPADFQAFSYHKRNGHGPLVAVLLMLFAIEGFAIHLLLAKWGPSLAWIMTASTIYGALWFVADFRAMVLRPNLINSKRIRLRSGLRFEVEFSRELVSGISKDLPDPKTKCLHLTLLGTPTHWIHLHEAVQAKGPYGIKRDAQVIGIQVDDAAAFESLLPERGRDSADQAG